METSPRPSSHGSARKTGVNVSGVSANCRRKDCRVCKGICNFAGTRQACDCRCHKKVKPAVELDPNL